jgi:tripartite-type tricarboxylate transporter receptor subunit TctC
VPKPIIDKIAAEVAKGWQVPDNIARLRTIGYEAWATTPEETAKLMAADRERWTAVVKANDIKAE